MEHHTHFTIPGGVVLILAGVVMAATTNISNSWIVFLIFGGISITFLNSEDRYVLGACVICGLIALLALLSALL